MAEAAVLRDAIKTFQSSPAFTGGRFPLHAAEEAGPLSFNPRPPLQAGALVPQVKEWVGARVSILARLYRRAL